MQAKKINIDKYVQFVEKGDSELYALKILQGPYSGVIYTYGKVRFEGTVEEPVVKFDFTINEVPKPKKKNKLEKSKGFKNFIGDVLMSLFDEQLQHDESTKTNNQTSND